MLSVQHCLFDEFEHGGSSFTRQCDCKAMEENLNNGASSDPGCRLVRTWRTAVSRSLSPALRISCMHTLEVETSNPSQIVLSTDPIPLGFKTSWRVHRASILRARSSNDQWPLKGYLKTTLPRTAYTIVPDAVLFCYYRDSYYLNACYLEAP